MSFCMFFNLIGHNSCECLCFWRPIGSGARLDLISKLFYLIVLGESTQISHCCSDPRSLNVGRSPFTCVLKIWLGAWRSVEQHVRGGHSSCIFQTLSNPFGVDLQPLRSDGIRLRDSKIWLHTPFPRCPSGGEHALCCSKVCYGSLFQLSRNRWIDFAQDSKMKTAEATASGTDSIAFQ